jgi:putative transposase
VNNVLNPNLPTLMYRWRKLSQEDQASLLQARQVMQRPWHSPPHFVEGPALFHLTAACFEHASIVGHSLERMRAFSGALLDTLAEAGTTTHAWCLLPNHYHLLVKVLDLKPVLAALGRLHGRSSFEWNGEDAARGRKVWSAPADRAIRNDAHFWATLNYIHHNPVRHGYVDQWQDWAFSSAVDYLAAVGREEAVRVWKAYPILDYGAGWDD